MPDWGGQGTGNSLQYLDGNWIPAIPTPGALNHSESIDETHTDDNDDNTGSSNDSNSNSSSNSNSDSDSTHSGQNGLSFEDAATNLKIGAGRTRYCIINTPIDFLAISNFNRDDHRKIKFNWSFGDADSKKGFSPDHTYYTAGGYNVVLNGKYNDSENMDQNATTRITVIIREPQISIDLIKSGKHVDILLNNESNFEVNFGGFYFKLNDEALFKIPNDTILSANSQITIAGEISNFQINPDMPEIIIKMYYPNGKFLAKESLGGSSVKVDSQTINLIRNLLDKENLQNFDLLIRNLNI